MDELKIDKKILYLLLIKSNATCTTCTIFLFFVKTTSNIQLLFILLDLLFYFLFAKYFDQLPGQIGKINFGSILTILGFIWRKTILFLIQHCKLIVYLWTCFNLFWLIQLFSLFIFSFRMDFAKIQPLII
jgi:hypothetical protein